MLKEDSPNPYLWSDTANKLRDMAAAQRIPLIGTFELTARCNLSCRMCYVSRRANDIKAKKLELGADEWIRLGRECLDAGTLFLLLTGGEPFLRKDFRKIYEALSEMGFIITLYTNGTLITDDTIQWLSKRPPSKLAITLYGASCDTYQQLCGNGSAFNKVMQTIKRLEKSGVNVYIRSTITKSNVQDLDNMKQIAADFDLPYDYTCMIFKPVRDTVSSAEEERLTPYEIVDLRSKITPPDFKEEDKIHILRKEKSSDPLRCTATKCSWWITWDGRIVPCSLMDTPYTKVAEKPFRELWADTQQMAKMIPKAPKCLSCPDQEYCNACPGILQSETGSFLETSDFICEVARHVKNHYSLCEEIK